MRQPARPAAECTGNEKNDGMCRVGDVQEEAAQALRARIPVMRATCEALCLVPPETPSRHVPPPNRCAHEGQEVQYKSRKLHLGNLMIRALSPKLERQSIRPKGDENKTKLKKKGK